MKSKKIEIPTIKTAKSPIPQDSMRMELQNKLEGVQARKAEFDTLVNNNKNKVEEFRSNLLNSLLEALKGAGVDMNNMESIKAFTEKLRIQDPDLEILLDNAFKTLEGRGAVNQETQSPENEQMNTNIQQ